MQATEMVHLVQIVLILKRGSYKQPFDAVWRNRRRHRTDPTPHRTPVIQKAVSYKKQLRDQWLILTTIHQIESLHTIPTTTQVMLELIQQRALKLSGEDLWFQLKIALVFD